jgi:tripartite-type tricarboxylate transporter receptor subunit TctC
VPLIAANIFTVLPHVKSGRLRAYGVSSAERSSAAPEIPTIAEAGLSGYEAVQWYGLVAPAKTPAPIVNQLHAAVVQVLNDPEIRQRFQSGGADPSPSESPAAYAGLIRSELKKWADVAKAAGIKPE